jgi:hypothetical protein
MKRRPRPRLMMLVLLLLAWGVAGAIVNVAVAWGCVLWSVPEEGVEFELAREDTERMIIARDVTVLYSDQPVARGQRSTGLTFIDLALDASDRQGLSLWSMITHAGLPCRSLTGELTSRGTTADEVYGGFKVKGAIEIPDSIRASRSFTGLLPLRPIWPGFAINTVFYAGVLWLLFAAPFALRRRRRIKRGLCPKCAYPVGTSAVCTECGAAVKAAS